MRTIINICVDADCKYYDTAQANNCMAFKFVPAGDRRCTARKEIGDDKPSMSREYVLDLKMARTRCRRKLKELKLGGYGGADFGRRELELMGELINEELHRIGAE